jgi:hypothetical protein
MGGNLEALRDPQPDPTGEPEMDTDAEDTSQARNRTNKGPGKVK